jgi:hypothetical protein
MKNSTRAQLWHKTFPLTLRQKAFLRSITLLAASSPPLNTAGRKLSYTKYCRQKAFLHSALAESFPPLSNGRKLSSTQQRQKAFLHSATAKSFPPLSNGRKLSSTQQWQKAFLHSAMAESFPPLSNGRKLSSTQQRQKACLPVNTTGRKISTDQRIWWKAYLH